MKTFSLTNSYISLEFTVLDNKKVLLSFLGDSVNYLNKPSSFIELDISEDDHLGCHCQKLCNTPYERNAKYISHTSKKNELIIVTATDNIECRTHFILRDNAKGYSCYSEITNISKKNIHLEYASSLYLFGLGQNDLLPHKDMYVYYASNSWCVECQWKKESFVDANLYNGSDRFTMRTFSLNNNGSWSTKNNLPCIIIENERNNTSLFGQVEHNGSWHIEIGDFDNQYYLSLSGPEMNDNAWCILLKPKQTFVTVEASISLGKDYEEAIQEMTKVRRSYIDKKHIDYKTQPVIFNDFMHGTWDLSSDELIKPYVDAASKVGTDIFVLDAGWFAKGTGWANYIGDYEEYKDNYPNGGLLGLCDYIRSKNMKVGLWFEIENVGISSLNANKLDEECFLHINGNRIVRNSRYCLNLANKKAFNHAFKLLSNAIKKYHLDYIKLDYNLDLGIGSDDSSNFLGNSLLEHNNGVIALLDKMHEAYPDLIIEDCASGGQRLDYRMLKHTQLASTSDLEKYDFYPYISCGSLAGVLPEQAGIWAYPVCNDNQKVNITDEVVIFNMCNGLIGRLTLASKIFNLFDSQLSLVEEAVSLAKELNDFRKEALPIFPCGLARFYDDSVVVGLNKENRIILYVFNMKDTPSVVTIDLSKYKIKDVKQIYPKKHLVKYSVKKDVLTVKFNEGKMGRIFEVIVR